MSDYLKNWMPIKFTADKKKITITVEFSIYENMSVSLNTTKTPSGLIPGSAIAYYDITESPNNPRGNKMKSIHTHPFTLQNNWNDMAPHFSGIQVSHPDSTGPVDVYMNTADAPEL